MILAAINPVESKPSAAAGTLVSSTLDESLHQAQAAMQPHFYTSVTTSSSIPRVNLRKRTVSGERNGLIISSVNSAFLSGLFADVAQVQDSVPIVSESRSSSAYQCSVDDDSSTSLAPPPTKKQRSSIARSMSRCGESFKNLQVPTALVSPKGVADKVDCGYFDREDSLSFQLNCVFSPDGNVSTYTPCEAAKLAFPLLPTAISSSSCSSTLTRKLSDLQSSIIENTQQESYGWFVDIDGDQKESVSNGVQATVPQYSDSFATTEKANLAFCAATAPEAINQDAEVEWAQAADTVDDVLGDFF